MSLPRLIALCGNPGAGKTETQKLLDALHGYVPVDDGLALRQIAFEHLGLTWHQVSTPEGKAEKVVINDREWDVRDVLGELGNALEEKFGGNVIPEMAMRANKIAADVNKDRRYSFGSVRRKQGRYLQQNGATVVEIQRPDVGPSRFGFDVFELEPIEYTIFNDGGLSHLDRSIKTMLRWMGGQPYLSTGMNQPYVTKGWDPDRMRNYERYFSVVKWAPVTPTE